MHPAKNTMAMPIHMINKIISYGRFKPAIRRWLLIVAPEVPVYILGYYFLYL